MSIRPVLAVIPARRGSKGMPGKNIRLLAGLPLICHSALKAVRRDCEMHRLHPCGRSLQHALTARDRYGMRSIAFPHQSGTSARRLGWFAFRGFDLSKVLSPP